MTRTITVNPEDIPGITAKLKVAKHQLGSELYRTGSLTPRYVEIQTDLALVTLALKLVVHGRTTLPDLSDYWS